ncbi:MAG: glycoside hydrolase family 76 protein [Vicinamibacteraceae bacterium]
MAQRYTRRWAMAVLSVFLVADASPSSDDGSAENYRAAADAGMAALDGWYDPATGLWESTGWWNGANVLEVTINYSARTGSTRYLDVLANTFERHSAGHFLNDFYDDEGWWALAWIKAYDLTGEVRYLEMAKTIFADITTGWDTTCGGGVWWSKARTYKNAIPNELFLTVAARLHQRTPGDEGPGSYLEWAERTWAWFEASGMINAQHLVNDGLTADCQNNNGTTWTYNQGVILGGLVELAQITHDTTLIDQAMAIADAAIGTLSNADEVLVEPCEPSCGADGPQFKGIFMRNLSLLFEATGEHRYRAFIERNAKAIWARARNTAYQLGLRWAGPFDSADAARQSSAMDVLNAAIPFSGDKPFAVNLARHEPATSSASCTDSQDASHAVDGAIVRDSKWCSPGATGQWLEIDLGTAREIRRFAIKHAGAGGEDDSYNTRAFEIQLSDDGASWDTVVEVQDNTASQTFHKIRARTARYVRLNIVSAQTNPDAQAARIYELDVYGPDGDPYPSLNRNNLALFKAAYANGACASSERPAFAVDGTSGSKWCAGATDGLYWLRLDFGKPVSIGRIVLKHAGAGGENPAFNTRDFLLEASADGTVWRVLADVTGNVANKTTQRFRVTSTQYLRLTITVPQSSPDFVAARIYELEVYRR